MKTNEEQVQMIKDDLRRDLVACSTSPEDLKYADWCRDLIARNDWTAKQFIHNRIPLTP